MKSFALSLALCATFATADAWAVTIDWVAVGNPGNGNDPATGFGNVAHSYNIDKYDVTNSQYVEFLNAKATGADPLGLYNSNMSDPTYGGITYNGSTYSVVSGDGNHPVNFVTFFDTLRFANWLNNGQGNGDTESGAYILQGGTPTPSNANTIARQAGATVFLPSENEWYKAAFYNAGDSSYLKYATGSNLVPTPTGPTATPNSANYGGVVGNLTDVGAYTGTTSPYGAYDMGGNVWQWNEGLALFGKRGSRGSSFFTLGSDNLDSISGGYDNPTTERKDYGFRVASVPEPSTFALAGLGFIGLAAWRLRRR